MRSQKQDRTAYLNATPMQRDVVRRLLCDLLACLRAQYLSYQTSHWQVVGGSFYGNHLLFERLYQSVQEQVDQLAEKIAGYLGAEVLGLDEQMEHMMAYTQKWSQVSCHHRRGIQSEADLQRAIRSAYEGIKQVKAMTLGLDDWLMATANDHDENEYLLQQALAQPPVAKQAAEVSVRVKGKEWSVEVDAPHQVAIYGPNGEEENGSLNRQLELEDFVDIPDEVLDALEAAIKKHSRKMRLGGHPQKQTQPPVAKQAAFSVALKSRKREDLIGYFYALHDQLEREFTASPDEIKGMSNAMLRRRTMQMAEQLADTDVRGMTGEEAVSAAQEAAPAAYRLMLRVTGEKKLGSGAPTAENDFYKDPAKREVLEFAESNAISNSVEVAEKASEHDHLDISETQAIEEALEAPPLPTEIAQEPGGAALSTLNRYVIDSEDKGAAEGVPMNESRMANWLRELDT